MLTPLQESIKLSDCTLTRMARFLVVGRRMFGKGILGFSSMMQAHHEIQGFYNRGELVSEGACVKVLVPHRKTFLVREVSTGKAGWLAPELLSMTGIEAGIFDAAGLEFDHQERVRGGSIVALAANSMEALWLFSMFNMASPAKRRKQVDRERLPSEDRDVRARASPASPERAVRAQVSPASERADKSWFLVRPFTTGGTSGRRAPQVTVSDDTFIKGIATAARSLRLSKPSEWTVVTEHQTPQPGATYALEKSIGRASAETPASGASSPAPSLPGLKRLRTSSPAPSLPGLKPAASSASSGLAAPAKAEAAAAKRGTGRTRDVEEVAPARLRGPDAEVAPHSPQHC